MPAEQSPSWWSQHWKWAVPTGCLVVVAAFALFVGAIAWFAMGMMRSNDAYAIALEKARANPAVVQALGTPIEAGMFTSGNVSISGPSGNAELQIPVSGPRGAGTIYLQAKKSAGEWTFSTLVVELSASRRRIDLLLPAAALPPGGEPVPSASPNAPADAADPAEHGEATRA